MADYSDMTSLLQSMPGGQPARPYSPNLALPTPMMGPADGPQTVGGGPSQAEIDIMDALYGPGPKLDLPSWVPPNVQTYMNNTPSFAEGQSLRPPRDITGNTGEPYAETPQIGDIKRLFQQQREFANRPPGQGFSADQLRQLYKLPGFQGWSGGTSI